MTIEISEETSLAALLIPGENGVNIGVTVEGNEDQHMWLLTPEMIAGVLSGHVVRVPHAQKEPAIVTSVSQGVKEAINNGGQH